MATDSVDAGVRTDPDHRGNFPLLEKRLFEPELIRRLPCAFVILCFSHAFQDNQVTKPISEPRTVAGIRARALH